MPTCDLFPHPLPHVCAQVCTTLLMLLSGLGTHPRAALTVHIPAASPFDAAPAEAIVEDALLPPLPPLSASMLADRPGCSEPAVPVLPTLVRNRHDGYMTVT